MNHQLLAEILQSVADGQLSVADATEKLRHLSFEDIEFAHVDHHRSLRKGFPEVIFGQGKTAEQVLAIMDRITRQENILLVTRIDPAKADAVIHRFPDAVYHPDARMIVWMLKKPKVIGRGTILVISAGTSDIPVANEAFLTAQAMGNRVETIFDVGVAGLHRLLSHQEAIQKASVLIVVAGMEGALPSVVAGMVDRPVIAVPTSIGYGVSLGGMTALFAMLNSCSSNVAVVNIDNGFGGGYVAAMINRP
jgi:NCAIR mutase (PurE)-related protein